MKVVLLAHTPEPERLIASAAKLCYSKSGIDGLYEKNSKEKSVEFIDMLSEIGHESPIEHISFTFGIEGVSRAFLAQITRHRIASYSVQSQRYVNKENFEFIIPPEIENDKKALSFYLNSMKEANENYLKLTEILKEKAYETLINEGKSEKDAKRDAEKKAIEDARFVLPNSCETKMIVTMNARSLLNFFKHRMCNRAQWEIQNVAYEMYRLVYAVAPSVFARSGPPCVYKNCPEGKMSCKKQKAVKERFSAVCTAEKI